VPGQDLAAILRQHGPLPVEQVLDFMLQAARGLQFAHVRDVVHRNVKPGNLLVSLDGMVKILDMGLASYDDESGEQLTQPGQMLGTVDYMSPEQATDARNADQRADIYSLGCTMYRLLTGQVPYAAKNAVLKAIAHAQSPIPALRSIRADVPESLELAYQRMVAKSPAARFPSMTAVIEALEACRQGPPDIQGPPDMRSPPAVAGSPAAPPVAVPPQPAPTPRSPTSRKKKHRHDITAVLAIGMAFVIILAGLLVLWLN
jgi:serine/threonine protein kinase